MYPHTVRNIPERPNPQVRNGRSQKTGRSLLMNLSVLSIRLGLELLQVLTLIIIIIIYLACRNWADTLWRQYISLTLLRQITAM